MTTDNTNEAATTEGSAADAPVIPEFLGSMSLEARQEFVNSFNKRDAKSTVDQIVVEWKKALQERDDLRKQLAEAQETIKHQGEVYAQEIVDHQTTRNRLQAAEDTVRGLRSLAGRAADVLQSVALPFSYVEEFKDELRQAAKAGDE